MTQSHGLPQPLSWSQLRDISIRTDEGAKRGTPQLLEVCHKKCFLSKILQAVFTLLPTWLHVAFVVPVDLEPESQQLIYECTHFVHSLKFCPDRPLQLSDLPA